MALFNKLFSTHKRKTPSSTPTKSNSKQFSFSNDQVRILLYRECDWRGRRLLFDSTALQKIACTNKSTSTVPQLSSQHVKESAPPISTDCPADYGSKLSSRTQGSSSHKPSNNCTTPTPSAAEMKKNPSYIETVNGISYRYARAEPDFNDIGEMVFGSVAMSVRTTTLKVHWLPHPTRFLCSQVFFTPIAHVGGSTPHSSSASRTHRSQHIGSDSAIDTSSLNSFSLSVCRVSDQMNSGHDDHQSKLTPSSTHPLDVPQQSSSIAVCLDTSRSVHAALSSVSERNMTYSDSGYGGTDGPWTPSTSSAGVGPFNSSTHSSLGSVFSDHCSAAEGVCRCSTGDVSTSARKFSTDSSMADYTAATTMAVGSTTSRAHSAKSHDAGHAGCIDCVRGRILRNITTSFETHDSISDGVGFVCDIRSAGAPQPSSRCRGGGSEGCMVGENKRLCGEQRTDGQSAAETQSYPEMMTRGGGGGGNSSDEVVTTGSLMPGGAMSATIANAASLGKRVKLGLALCIQLSDTAEAEMQQFCSEHMVLLESMLSRLRAAAEHAYANQKRFYQLMLRAWMATAQWLVDLFTAPRIVEPVWLALSGGYATDAKQLAHGFMHDLSGLLNSADTKDTNFFISTLLTAILTQHLGWVSTVSPIADSPVDVRSNNDLTSFRRRTCEHTHREKISDISRYYPYNVLWAQMNDLYGAIGTPPKVSKTIVSGCDESLISRVLKVLTYFIRCGQIERDIRAEVFEKQVIDDILGELTDDRHPNSKHEHESVITKSDAHDAGNDKEFMSQSRQHSLTRSATCMSGLGTCQTPELSDDCGVLAEISASQYGIGRKNDIPNVLIFRDSRFVKQELRIGNFLMDTGIEMTDKQRQSICDYRVKPILKPKFKADAVRNVRFLVTSPTIDEQSNDNMLTDENIPTSDTNVDSELMLDTLKTIPNLSVLITANSMGNSTPSNCIFGNERQSKRGNSRAFLWSSRTEANVSEEQWQHSENGCENRKTGISNSAECLSTVIELKRSHSMFTKSTNGKNVHRMRRTPIRKQMRMLSNGSDDQLERKNIDEQSVVGSHSFTSLADLITANSCGSSERLTWGIEPVKESVTLEEVHHFENTQKRINDHSQFSNSSTTASKSNVVFVLGGENETLTNLKSSVPKKPNTSSSTTDKSPIHSEELLVKGKPIALKTCSHKKHSGVKFNFEKYPQIATNYMKNKNIDLTHYEFTADKMLGKLIDVDNAAASSSTTLANTMNKVCSPPTQTNLFSTNDSDDDTDISECECCAGNATRTLLQTPSNATELEFSNDDSNYPTSTAAIHQTAPERTESTSQLAFSRRATNETTVSITKTPTPKVISNVRLITLPISKHKLKSSTTPELLNGNQSVISVQQWKKSDKLPVPSVEERAGFIPSLFVGITDHYVADMVLQGTTAPLSAWEKTLKQNLTIAAHSAVLEPSRTTENVAILANTNKWDVTVVSSQKFVLPCGSATSGCSIGMSQLVATMLETVNAMWSAGLPAYQCMAYIESKLQELYLQSETLAAFLLATEFCSLGTVTAALNLSENDVPLLLSIASVHSPQVMQKYGVSFR